MKYRKSIICLVSVLAVATVAWAGVKDTKHNFASATSSPNAYFSGTTQPCVFCHTAHNAGSEAPLWNHENTAPPLYDVYGSNSIDMTIQQPHQGSLICLSCHDGTIAINSLSNLPGPSGAGNYGFPAGAALDGLGRLTATSSAFIGTDLSNDHPVGIIYDATKDPTGFVNKTGSSLSYPDKLLQDGIYVECSSCHNPHDDTYTNFLIESNTGSALCQRCHTK